ncbi:MAG: Imm44 family immunity protein [Clostridium sp.]|nr:Imm44 family immunity protein [Clostridium sp.]MCM1208682.1 Imm44 family immunity protein [Ruminococcus sp.]
MRLNVNSPAYFSEKYGIDNDVYRYCQNCYKYFLDKEYSPILEIVGIIPLIVPQELYEQGKYKEKVQFIANNSCAIIYVKIDFEKYLAANSEEKIFLMKDAIVRAIKKIKAKGKFDYKKFCEDLRFYN